MASDARRQHDAAFLQMGVYRHYKGQHYLVLGLAHDANADELMSITELGRHLDSYPAREGSPQTYPESLAERWVVVYVPLELEGAHTGPRLAVRTLADFRAIVCGQSWCPAYGRTDFKGCPDDRKLHATDRFAYVGPTWEGS